MCSLRCTKHNFAYQILKKIHEHEHVLGPLPDSDPIAGMAFVISLRSQPLTAKIVDGMSAVSRLSSKFEDVPKGSPLSYQCSALQPKDQTTPKFSPLRIALHALPPYNFVPGSWAELLHMQSLEVCQGSSERERRSIQKPTLV